MTLTEFLTARLDEWEKAAVAAAEDVAAHWMEPDDTAPEWDVTSEANEGMSVTPASYRRHRTRVEYEGPTERHVALNDPAFVLAQVATIRAVLAIHAAYEPIVGHNVTLCEVCVGGWPCATLRALTKPYADHPDHRAEWA